MKLILVRHGETTGNSSQHYWGATDVALSKSGLKQAESLAQKLRGETIHGAYCSMLKRAVATAAEITRGHGVTANVCTELNEMNFGLMEGLTAHEIRDRYPEFHEKWVSWDTDFEFPGGESVSGFRVRVARFPTRLVHHDSPATILVVAHAGVLRMLICELLELPFSYWRRLRLDLGSVSTVQYASAGSVLTGLNDTSHL